MAKRNRIDYSDFDSDSDSQEDSFVRIKRSHPTEGGRSKNKGNKWRNKRKEKAGKIEAAFEMPKQAPRPKRDYDELEDEWDE